MAQEMCKIHQDKEVIEVCAHCGRGVCASCAAALGGKTYCLDCIKHVDPAVSDNNVNAVAWENREQTGFFSALFKTWLDVLMHPKDFFSSMPVKAGIKEPFFFALICGSLAIILSAAISLIGLFLSVTPVTPEASPSKAVMSGSYIILMVVSPLLVSAGIFIGSGIYHLVIRLFGGIESFRATFRVLSYVNALALFNVIPIAGPIFVTIYSMVLFVIGFKRAHKMSTPRAVMAALLPMVVLFVVGFLAAFYMASHGVVAPVPGPVVTTVPSSAPAVSAPAVAQPTQ